MSFKKILAGCSALLALTLSSQIIANEKAITLSDAIKAAIKQAPSIQAQQSIADANRALAISAGTWSDPMLKLGMMNMPTDDFDLGKEGMTQMQIGIKQQIPRGSSLRIKSDIQALQAEADSFIAQNQEKVITREVSGLWFEYYYWTQARQIVEQNKKLFDELLSTTKSLYSVGKKNQQDVINAQVQLLKLEERLSVLAQKQQQAKLMLSRWTGPAVLNQALSKKLPELQFVKPQKQIEWINHHPIILQFDETVAKQEKQVDLKKQDYWPGVSVEANYGFRKNDKMGNNRPDMLSAMVMFDLPIFTSSKQDKNVQAMQYKVESARALRNDKTREMLAQLSALFDKLEHIQTRKALYQKQLLPQLEQQAKITLAGYQADTANFSDTTSSYVNQLNAMIDYERIKVDEQQTIAQIQYFEPKVPAPAFGDGA